VLVRSKKLDNNLMILALVGALGAGCGGDVKSPGEDDATPAKSDAGTADRPETRDAGPAGSAGEQPRTPGVATTPTAPAPEGRSRPELDNRRVGALAPNELKELCEDGRKQVVRALVLQNEGLCTSAAIASTKTASECNAKRTMCIAQLGASPAPLPGESCETDARVLKEDCAELSVAEVRGCADAWTAQLERAAASANCSMAGTPVQAPMLDAPEECQNIDARCRQ
jgi:hypothetical protein